MSKQRYPFVNNVEWRFDWNDESLNDPKLQSPEPCPHGWNCDFRSNKTGRPCSKVHPGEEGCSRRIFEANGEHKFDCVRLTGCPYHNHQAHFYERCKMNMTFKEYKSYKKWKDQKYPRSGFCTYYADEEKKALEAKEENKVVVIRSVNEWMAEIRPSLVEEISDIFAGEDVKQIMVNMGYDKISSESVVDCMLKNLASCQIVEMGKDMDKFINHILSSCEYLSKQSNAI
jgi:hypothetical protein